MQCNNLQSNQSNNTHNASFATNPAAAGNQQPGASSQARVLPPLADAADLSSNPAARNLQSYNPISIPQGSLDPLAPDNWNLPEYQPIQPGAPYMEKLADEAMNTKKLNICLKNARDNEELEDFSDAEEAYEKALKYTENAAHYKLYAGCLKEIYLALSRIPLTPAKDEAKERLYKEKAAKAFYYLGDLYQKQGALQEAQAAYRASSELALYELPLKALVDVARHLGEATPLAAALENLGDFYAQKGAIALAIDKLKEAFEVGKIARVLEKLEALYSGEGNHSQMHELAIQRFELQISQDPKNIGLYRDYGWFLKDIGRKSEARVVKKRMDGLSQTMQQKLAKQKSKIGGLKQTIHLQEGKLETLEKQVKFLEKQVFYLDFNNRRSRVDVKDADFMQHLLEKNPNLQFLNLERCEHLTDDVLLILPERFENLQELNLRGCKRITEAGLDAIAENATQLKHLILDNCPNTTIRLLHKLNAKGITFAIEGVVFPTRKLDLSNRKDTLTDDELRQALEANPEITELSLDNCSKITNSGLALLKNFQWLTSLEIRHCTQLNDAGLEYLADLTQLRELYLGGCLWLTNEGLRYLATFTQLTVLGLGGCKITDTNLHRLARLTQLTTLNVGDCPDLTNNAKAQLKKQIPGLTING